MPVAARMLDHVALAMNYAESVIAEKIPACRWVRLACERQLRDLDRWNGKDHPYFFDTDAADRVCDIVRRMPHIKGHWAKRLQKIDLEPWQAFILTTVFGWKRAGTDDRRYRVAYIEVPRKNAKSTLTSALGLFMVACDGESGAYVVSAANTRDQAKLVFTDAQQMAKREPGFMARFGVQVLAHTIVVPKSAGKFEALSAEHSNLDGLNIHAALIDELHAHPTRGLWDILETATGSRTQSLIWAITTAGTNRASVCYDQRTHLIDVLSGTYEDDTYFGVIYTIDDGDDPWTENSWIKANPNWGVSVLPDNIRPEAKRATQIASQQNAFLTKHLDVWVNAEVAWLPPSAWDKCADAELDIADFEQEPCYIGVDLAWRSDIAAVVAAFPPHRDREHWAVFGFFYLPEETVQKAEHAHYQGWESSGRLIATEGPVTDFDVLADQIESLYARFDVIETVFDPFHAGPLQSTLLKRGVRKLVEVKQTAPNMSPGMVHLEGLILDRKIRHDGDPIFAWMVANTKTKRSQMGDLISPTKESEDRKIDGVTALILCMNRGIRREGSRADYENRGLWVI